MDPVPASPVQSQVYLQEKGRGAAGKCLQTQGRESNKNGWIRILKIAWSYYMCVLRRFEGNASGTGNNGPSHLLWHWIQLPECPQPTAITRSRRIKCWGVANEIQPPNINLIFEIKSRMILEDRLIQIIRWGGVPKGFCNTLSTTRQTKIEKGVISCVYIYTVINKNTDKGLPCVLVLISNTRPGCFPSPELLRARELQQLHSCWPVCTWSTDASVIANDARCNLRIPHPEPKRNGSAWKRQISIICPLWRVAGMPRGRTFFGCCS